MSQKWVICIIIIKYNIDLCIYSYCVTSDTLRLIVPGGPGIVGTTRFDVQEELCVFLLK